MGIIFHTAGTDQAGTRRTIAAEYQQGHFPDGFVNTECVVCGKRNRVRLCGLFKHMEKNTLKARSILHLFKAPRGHLGDLLQQRHIGMVGQGNGKNAGIGFFQTRGYFSKNAFA